MILWDAHACLPQHPDADFAPVRALRAAGVNYVSLNVGADMNPLSQIMSVISGYRATIAAHPDLYMLALTIDDVRQAKAENRIALSFDLEGALPLMERPDMVALYHQLGVRQIHFAYNRNNSVAGGCHDSEQGLTVLGRRMLKAVNDAGMLIDCSHTGRRSSLDIMAHSQDPVIFSHSNPAALVKHGRNIDDEQILACAATGGVVCVSGLSRFLGTNQPGVADVARHAAYVANLAGIAHAGIGLDICFTQADIDDTPPGHYRPEYWWPPSAGYGKDKPPCFVATDSWRTMDGALQATGMTAAEAALVMGGNMMRVAQQVWI